MEAADMHFQGVDLCDVLILKSKSDQENLQIELNTDPANLVKPRYYN